MKKILAVAFVSSLMSLPAFADDTCDSCHGIGGNSNDDMVPSIAGYSAGYIADSLNNYKDGRPSVKFTPKGGAESDMVEVAKKLSDAEIEKVANEYAGKTFKAHAQAGDAGKIAAGKKLFAKKCDKCHENAGSSPEDDAGLLLGQQKGYLTQQLKVFMAGERDMPKKMKKKLKKLSDADRASIVEYLASGKL